MEREFLCMVCMSCIRCLGPMDQPNFHPVTLNVFPALPMVMVRSHMPGKVAEKDGNTGVSNKG